MRSSAANWRLRERIEWSCGPVGRSGNRPDDGDVCKALIVSALFLCNVGAAPATVLPVAAALDFKGEQSPP
jgi:hypothetical protein